MSGVPHLQELFDKYTERGFKICAVSSEAEDKIQTRLIDAKKVTYGVVKANIKSVYTAGGIPECWILDDKGKCLFKGHPSGVTLDKVKKWVDALAPLKIKKDLGRSLAKAVSYFNKGEFGKAEKEAIKVKDSDKAASDKAVIKNADYILGLVRSHTELAEKKIKTFNSSGDLSKTAEILHQLATWFKGTEKGDEYAKAEKELKKSKEYKNSVKAFESLEKLRPKLPYLTDDKAKKGLEKIAKKYPETKAGKEAKELSKEYE